MLKSLKTIALSFLVVLLGAIAPAQAGSQDAKAYIVTMGDKVLGVLKDGSLSDDARRQKLSALFDQSIDTQWIGRFVLGTHWRKATPAQQQKFISLYRQFLLANYVPRFRDYAGEKFNVIGVRDGGAGEFLVQTQIISPNGEPPISVDYRVKQQGNNVKQYKVLDIVAEGVSVISTHRAEFGSVATREGVDGLLAKLQAKLGGTKQGA